MKKMKFKSPKSLSEVCSLLAGNRGKCCLIAGGTDLIIEMRQNRLSPESEILIDISSLKELKFIREDDESIYIGAGTTHSELSASGIIKDSVLFLSEAAGFIGSPQTRTRGTIGGNIITAAQCADTIPPLLVLNAELKLLSSGGERIIAIKDFFKAPKKTDIHFDEVLTEIRFKKPDDSARAVFKKLIRRKAIAKARINFCALAVQNSEGKITDIRISPGSVTPVHMRFSDSEGILLGKIPNPALIKEAAVRVSEKMVAVTGRRWSTSFKEPVLATMAERGLLEILEVKND